MTKDEAREMAQAYREIKANFNKEIRAYLYLNPVPAYKRNPRIKKHKDLY